MNLAEAIAELESKGRNLPDFLLDEGIKGVREDCHTCPVAVWLYRKTRADRILVDAFMSTVVYVHADGSETDVVEFHHRHVTDFIVDFDNQIYPELDKFPTEEIA